MQTFHFSKKFFSEEENENIFYNDDDSCSSSSHNSNLLSSQLTPSHNHKSYQNTQNSSSNNSASLDVNNDSIEVIVSDLEYELDQDNNDNDNENDNKYSTSSNSTLIQYTKASRNQNSFIKFNNKLRLSLERESNNNTSSYLMALLDLDAPYDKNYEVSSIIEEEDYNSINEKKLERHHTQSIQFKMKSLESGYPHSIMSNKSNKGIHTKAKSELLQLKLTIPNNELIN